MLEKLANNKNLKVYFVFIMSFLLLLLYHRNTSFMDEADNLVAAISIVNGGDIYKGFFSQHTPFVYYYMSIFSLFGVRDYETFRLCMSFTLLLTWIFMFYRYSEYFNKTVVLIFIALYALTVNITWGYMILSDVFQGYAVLILLLEALIFQTTKSLTTKSMIIVSLAIFIASMSAFVSVYPIFMIALLFFRNIVVLPFNKIRVEFKNYLKLILVIAIPFVILVTWYLITGNLKNFFEQSYQFNRLYYSKYLGGFGSSAIDIFKSVPFNWTSHIKNSLLSINQDNIFNALLVIFNLLYLYIQFNRNKLSGIILFFFLGFCGIRGYVDFHSLNYYIVSFFSVAFVADHYYKKINEISELKSIIIKVLVFLVFLVSFNSYIPNAGMNLTKGKGMLAQNIYYDSYIQKLTNKDDLIWITNLTTQSYINNHRRPAVRVATLVPWFYDAYKTEMLEDLKRNKPKLIIFEKDNEVWGHVYSQFAPEIFEYINENYIALNENDSTEKNIYVEKENYNEISAQLWPGVSQLNDGDLVSNQSRIFLIEDGLKRHISSPDVFNSKGYNWNAIKEIDDDTISKIKTGPEITN
ncbi:hypothetical protein [Paenibacillus tianjinensis]|uniref:Glycosyltransferase RgtA/B/C/D-like domain-containing protein n=1 Tax=Paenibacillus tianjinensis TaxID=2810347 RepID=A0ABX7L906_9BACL|nr:hypothetical protein [Paenibacillus tianjinensis]QSF44670.1 hypothetical protein JRJ22_26550 [Paenibacillus tianjinensis]